MAVLQSLLDGLEFVRLFPPVRKDTLKTKNKQCSNKAAQGTRAGFWQPVESVLTEHPNANRASENSA